MRKNMQTVIAAFIAGKPAKEKTCWTDGDTVWSYRMPIAHRAADGTVYIVNYIDAPTVTTRSQVRALERSFPSTNVVRVSPMPIGRLLEGGVA